MRFALINDELVEAQAGLKGTCRGCGQPVIAKCGTFRVHHWAHQKTEMCDNWWQPETEWHRSWKSNFPPAWQEFFMLDEKNGEKHIADVRTAHGLVIEFQYSHLKPEERIARENFYKGMVWIVDGTRLKYDYPHFKKARNKFLPTNQPNVFEVDIFDDGIPAAWRNCAVPVIFDFKEELTAMTASLECTPMLYCLFPVRTGRYATLAEFSVDSFIGGVINGKWLQWACLFMESLKNRKEEYDIRQLENRLQVLQMQQARRRRGYGNGRIF